jgi:hypothetical protein
VEEFNSWGLLRPRTFYCWFQSLYSLTSCSDFLLKTYYCCLNYGCTYLGIYAFFVHLPMMVHIFKAMSYNMQSWGIILMFSLSLLKFYVNILSLFLSLNKNSFFFVFSFLQYWGLNSGPTPWATLPVLYVIDFFEIGCCEWWAGFEPWSSWSLLSKFLPLQLWVTGAQFIFSKLTFHFIDIFCLSFFNWLMNKCIN